MTFLPVVAREMTVLARRKSTYWSRAAASIIAVLVMFWVLLVSASRVSFAEMGSSMFLVLSSLCFGFALFVGMQATADCLSEEKREGTLGLLFLTDLTGMDIVLGKLAASSLNAGFAFLGVIPMLSLAMLLGGVSFVQFGLIALVLLNTMFLSLSLGVLVSALSKNERKAMLGSFLAIFLVTALPLLSVYAFANFRGPFLNEPLWPFSPSPFFGFACIHIRSSLIPFPTMPFAGSLLLQHLLAWACLFSASRILPNCISDLPAKRFVRLRAAFHDYVFGKLEQRKRHRAELLDRNAFLWLASRERVKPKYAWVVLAFFVGLFVWVYLQFPNMIFDAPVALSIIFLTQFIFKIWTASEVCSRLIEDRRSGALELLLSSPLSVRAIAQGQGLALRRIFLKPVAALVISEMVLMFLVLNSLAGGRATVEIISSYLIATTSLLLDLWALKWVGLWLSLFGKSIERVLIATVARVLALPWLCFAIAAGIVGAIRYFQDKSLGEEETLLAWWLIGALFSLGLGFSARLRFLNYFRVIAGEGFDLRAAPGLFRAKKNPSTPREPSGLPAVLLRHWFFSGATAVILIAFAVVWGRQFYWKRQVRSELNRVQANQLPATGAQLAAYYPMPSARENAFASLSPNVAAIPARGMGSSRILWGPMAFSTRSLGGTDENEIERLRPFVRGMKKELDALHALGRFKKGYLDPAQDDWNFSLRASGYVDLVWAELQVNYFDENFPAVFTDLETLIQLARLFRQQPSAQAQNVCAEALHL
ncbi:MAG TPA: hypothetical protein VGR78_02395, partial [Verrucomicrobiae bacterium]|nr:hypothetical protein [Verrucomicrobiae bacterium]